MPDLFLFSGLGTATTILTVLGIIGIIVGIVLLFVFLPARNKVKYTGAAKWFYDFLNFNTYWISSIIKVIFIAVTIVCLLGGFICLFIIPALGLALILYSVIARLIFELILVMLSIRENTSQISDMLANKFGIRPPAAPLTPTPYAPVAQPDASYTPPAPPTQPAPVTCGACGAINSEGSKFCIQCGTPING